METVGRLQPDELWSKLPHSLKLETDTDKFKKRPKTKYGRKQEANTLLKFRLDENNLPRQVAEEFADLVQFYTCPSRQLQKRDMARASTWRLPRSGKGGTQRHKLALTCSMLGYASLPAELTDTDLARLIGLGFRDMDDANNQEENDEEVDLIWDLERGKKAMTGLGYGLDQLSIAFFSDETFGEQFVKYAQNRAIIDSGGVIAYLNFICLLTRPNNGYLWWHESYADRLPAPMRAQFETFCRKDVPEDERSSKRLCWRAWCQAAHAAARATINDIQGSEDFGLGRDPNEPIEEITGSAQPLQYLHLLHERMQAALPGLSVQSEAAMKRNMFMVSLLTACPVRRQMVADMQWGKNLYQKDNGSWWLKFEARDFKNWKSAMKTDYDWPLPKSLWPEIEEYKTIYRPRLTGAATSNKVFVKKDRKGGMTAESVMETIRKLTFKFLGICFGPHAFRHIVATAILKRQPGCWFLAAKWLHDKEATVREAYAHLAPKDSAVVINQFLEETFSRNPEADE